MLAAALMLDVVALAIAMSVVVRRVWRRKRIRVDHVLLFCIGHAYYLSLGSIASIVRPASNTYWFVYSYWNQVSDGRRFLATVWSLAILLGFLVGNRLARSNRRGQPSGDTATGGRDLAAAVVVTSTVLVAFVGLAIVYRPLIIEGYSSLDPSQIQGQTGRGVLSAGATAAILSGLFLMDRRSRLRLKAPSWGVNALVVMSIALPAAVLLRAGGRMYVATSLVAIVVWYSHARRPISTRMLLAAGAFGFAGLVVLGAVRVGEAPSGEALVFYSTSESVLTGIGQANFLGSNADVTELVRVPKYLATDLTNVLPRALVPGKDQLRFDPLDDGFVTTSPLGATSLQASALINFGLAGSIVAATLFGFALERLRDRALGRSALVTMAYSSIAAACLFSLFRDPFSISVARWMLLNAVVLPAGYLAAAVVIRRAKSPRYERVTNAATPI